MAIYPEGDDMFRPAEYQVQDHELEDMLIDSMIKEKMQLLDDETIMNADQEIMDRQSRQNFDYGSGESGTVEMDGSTINYTMDNPDALFQEPPAPGYHEIERDGQLFGVEIMDDGTIGSVSPLGGQIVGGDALIDEQLSPSEGLSIDNYSAYSEKFDENYNPETGMTWDGSRIDTEISPAGQDLSRMFSAQDLQTGQVVSDLLLGTLAAPMIPGMGLRGKVPLKPFGKQPGPFSVEKFARSNFPIGSKINIKHSDLFPKAYLDDVSRMKKEGTYEAFLKSIDDMLKKG